MLFEFDPSAIRAELKTEGDHWVVALEMGTGRWGHKETSWRDVPVSRDEIRDAIGDDSVSDSEDVIAYVEMCLRRAAWRPHGRAGASLLRCSKSGTSLRASEYVRPYHLFHGPAESAEPQD